MATKPIASVTTATPVEADQVLGVKAGATRLFSLLSITNLVGVNIRKFYETADGSNWSPALNRALAVSPHVDFPAGSYTFVTPVNYIQGMVLTGAKEMKSSAVGGTRITANAGWLKNDNTTRKQIIIRNFYVKGNRTVDVAAIDGPFGGVIEGCRLDGFESLVRNASGYLCQYIRNSFNDASFGINTADANGVVIEDNHFDTSVEIQITNRDVTPQSGTNNGAPIYLRGNNFNTASITTVACKLRGLIIGHSNYFEDFTGGPSAATFLDLEVNRFDEMGIDWRGNEMNGQGNGVTAIRINGSHAPPLSNSCSGMIAQNRIIGCLNEVIYGTNNRIPGLTVLDAVVTNSFSGQHLPPDAWTYVKLSSDLTTSLATVVDSTLAFTPAANKQYLVEGMLMVRTVTTTIAPRPSIVWPTGLNDGVGFMQASSSAQATVPRYGNPNATIEVATGDLADTTGSWPVKVEATLLTGATPSGDFRIGLRAETAGTNVTLRAGSWIRYREI